MIKLIKLVPRLIKNMGFKYVLFRSFYEIQRKLGFLKHKYPENPIFQEYISLVEWKKLPTKFFFDSREKLNIVKKPNDKLKEDYNRILNGEYPFFNSIYFRLEDIDWITNISTNYKYDISKHWTEIEDINVEAGDIKYVWELSRFSFLYTIIRYDFHFEEDCSDWVFSKIEDWIEANPINKGPNYKCSQEIGLRVLNWTFALFYYRNSENLTETRFAKILHHVRWQIHHVFENINFSLISVRNNHAISETTAIYLVGLLYPFLPNANKWKIKGKEYVEKEIKYQVYNDGTYLMYSNNYHRTVLQFFTWILYLSNANLETLTSTTYDKIYKSINFLFNCHDSTTGFLSNYGHNDGSLFCKLNDNEFRDFRSQLNAIYYFFQGKYLFNISNTFEESLWYSQNKINFQPPFQAIILENIASYSDGGYYTIRDEETLSFIRCGNHPNRPSQADNLHFDLWYKGNNVLRDAGTYKYNTSQDLIKYFSGTKAHNTVSIGGHDQMEKGPRFIWLNWSQVENASLTEDATHYKFTGTIKAFQHIDNNAKHTRILLKEKNNLYWEIKDTLAYSVDLPIKQYWNKGEKFDELFEIIAVDEFDKEIQPVIEKGWYSGMYGIKEVTEVVIFETKTKQIKTIIKSR